MNKKKIGSLTRLLYRLRTAKHVSPREISKVLNKSQIQEIEEHWEYQKSLKKLKRPEAIQKYAEMIRIACLYYAKMDKYCFAQINRRLAKKFAEKAESTFEKALEFIREAIQIDPELQIWLDRDFRDIRSYCPVGIPRVIGSASSECQDKNKQPYKTFSKRELLIEYLEMALYDYQDHTFDEFMTEYSSANILMTKRQDYDFSEFKF